MMGPGPPMMAPGPFMTGGGMPPMGSGMMPGGPPMMGPMGPMGSGMMGPPGPMGPMGPMPPHMMGPMGPPLPVDPVMAHMVGDRLIFAEKTQEALKEQLEMNIKGGSPTLFSYGAEREGLTDIDWRVPKLMQCRDPKYNIGLDPRFAYDIQTRKMRDGRALEDELSKEAYVKVKEELEKCGGGQPPPVEIVKKKGVPFPEAIPYYQREDDVWQRKLELRTMEEAMRGDVSQPMPRPCIFNEDFENYREGKYVKDDCPIA